MQWLRGAIPALLVLSWASLPSCGSGFSAGSTPHEQDGTNPDASSAGDGSGSSPGSGGELVGTSGGGGKGSGGGAGGDGQGGDGQGGNGQSGGSGGHPSGGSQGGRPSGGAGGRPAAGAGGAASGGGTAAAPDAGHDAAPPSPVVPTDGLVLWLRADRGVTVKDGLVTSWADQSPSGAVASQDQDDSKPVMVSNGLNGQPAIQFNDDYLQLGTGYSDFSFGLTMFTVAAPNDVTSCMGVFEASNGREINDISFDSDFGKFNYEVQDENYEDVLYPQGLAQLFSVVHHTDGSVVIDRNGRFGEKVQMMLPEVLPRTEVYLGLTLYSGCSGFKGRISEFILYARALGDAEVLAVDKYLQTKYSCCTTP